MGIPHKDPEHLIRKAKDRIVGGIADTRKKLGILPDTKSAEEFAKPVIEQTLREREEQRNKAHFTKKAERPAPVAVDRDDVRETSRSIGSVTFDKRTGRVVDSNLNVKPKTLNRDALTCRLLADRLELLGKYPDWKKRVEDAWFKTIGGTEARTWAVLKVVEASKKVFGEQLLGEQARKLYFT